MFKRRIETLKITINQQNTTIDKQKDTINQQNETIIQRKEPITREGPGETRPKEHDTSICAHWDHLEQDKSILNRGQK